MKKLFNLFPVLFFGFVMGILPCSSTAQNTEKQEKENAKIEALKKLVESRHFMFTATTATPMSGRTRQLTSTYTLTIMGDTVIADLPYYGRSYQASIGETDGGLNFKTTEFAYNLKDGTKGGWDITIMPKDNKYANTMLLSISNSGYANLQINSNIRQTIYFRGTVSDLTTSH
ncbi:MAG: hypothetical protein C5B59_06465 [Bacteroidetes bacterium]|nr:MAG: hypothetical protein C5B59_06465 [Bacteroidota bacterium]